MIHKKLSALLFVAAFSTTQVSSLDKSGAVGVGLGVGLVATALAAILVPDHDIPTTTVHRHWAGASIHHGHVPLNWIVALTLGPLSGLLAYQIAYHSFVNDGTCSLCHDRINSWSHSFDTEVKVNCGHRFRKTCLSNFMKRNGDRCPTCGANVYNMFNVAQTVYVHNDPLIII